MTRQSASEILETQYDVIVIGAGINGAGIARDAAMRGLKVLLLDKGDVGGGTSSLSTRLIHGGLRYLEHGEFGLVRESLRERELLMKIAPHLVCPLRILVPIYKQARRGLWTVRAGMIAYDALSSGKTLPSHQMLSAAETLQQAPGLRPEELVGAAVYSDAQIKFAERLVLENVLSAVEHGATVVTYALVDKLVAEDGKIRSVEYTLDLQGRSATTFAGAPASHQKENEVFKRECSASASFVINAAGPWIDQILAASALDSPRLIGGTKGSHLIVAPFPGAPEVAIYVEAESDHRSFFIIPWNENYLIGTTDIRFEGDLDNIQIDTAEIEYLLKEANRVLPLAQLTRKQILYTYSGVRPLPFVRDQQEEKITRKHFIRGSSAADNLFSIVGGKLTTYRSLAAETVDLILRKLGRNFRQCTTDRERLPGAAVSDFATFVKGFKRRSGLSEAANDRLLGIYGSRSAAVIEFIKSDVSLGEVFDKETGAMAAEVVLAFQQELAQTLSDCLLRRTMVGLNSSCGLNAVDGAARIAQQHLGWTEERTTREIDHYRKEVSPRFRG